MLEVVFDDEEHNSEFLKQFAEQVDEGYRISVENDLIQHTDSTRIETWMNLTSAREPPATDCDDWECRSIAFGEGVSVIAEGFSRNKIDRWKCMCEETQAHLDELISSEDHEIDDEEY
jgi:hypothetical protein